MAGLFTHRMRDFTATAVKEHLRSQIEDRESPPELTQKEVELVRFICAGQFDWNAYLAERSNTAG